MLKNEPRERPPAINRSFSFNDMIGRDVINLCRDCNTHEARTADLDKDSADFVYLTITSVGSSSMKTTTGHDLSSHYGFRLTLDDLQSR